MKDLDSIVRVFRVNQTQRQFIGTAFAVGPKCFLTCKHLFAGEFQNAAFVLRGHALYGDIALVDWHLHPELDFACGIVRPGIGGLDVFMPIKLTDVSADRGPYTCAGYVDESGGLQQWTDHVSGNSLVDGWIALQNTISDGVSGGPVLHAGMAVAIVRADSQRRNQTYVMPLAAVHSWLETLGAGLMGIAPERSTVGAESNPVRRLLLYPIGPAVFAIDIPDEIIEIFVQHFRDPTSAERFLATAMALRSEANKERFRDRQILVFPGDLPTPGRVPMEEYWAEVFVTAGAASRRTLAALFEAPGAPIHEMLSDYAAAVYRSYTEWLREVQRQHF